MSGEPVNDETLAALIIRAAQTFGDESVGKALERAAVMTASTPTVASSAEREADFQQDAVALRETFYTELRRMLREH
jgi:hypothetical protein